VDSIQREWTGPDGIHLAFEDRPADVPEFAGQNAINSLLDGERAGDSSAWNNPRITIPSVVISLNKFTPRKDSPARADENTCWTVVILKNFQNEEPIVKNYLQPEKGNRAVRSSRNDYTDHAKAVLSGSVNL